MHAGALPYLDRVPWDESCIQVQEIPAGPDVKGGIPVSYPTPACRRTLLLPRPCGRHPYVGPETIDTAHSIPVLCPEVQAVFCPLPQLACWSASGHRVTNGCLDLHLSRTGGI